MMRTCAAAALALAMSASGIFGGLAHAQTAERTYDNGPVWTISQIETKPGMFDDYMKYVSTNYRQTMEAGMKAGRVLAWKVLSVDSARDHEPDVILMVEFKNMAAFDVSLSEQEAITASVFGSVVKSNQAYANREALRTLRGSLTARELVFVK